jgi:2-keto-4-pentenoate hydratase
VELGYATQRRQTEGRLARGERIAGYKAAFTSEPAQRAMGIAAPAYAPLFESMRIEAGGLLDLAGYTALRAEVELAFRLGADLGAPFDPGALRLAVASLHVALELPDLRPAGRPTVGALIADGIGARHFALGPPHPPQGIDAAALGCELEVDGSRVASGKGSAALGDPWKALAWLVEEHLRSGGRLAAGDVVLTGALGEIWTPGATPPRELVARCERLGEVRVRVAPSSPGSP